MALSQAALTALYAGATSTGVAASGTITFSGLPSTATHATGTLTFSGGLPVAGETFAINGTTVTFRASGATGNEVNIAGTANATATAVYNFLRTSADSGLAGCTYADNGSGVITITAKVWGTAGNSITLAESATNVAKSGTTLSGASAGDSVTVNSVALQFIPASSTSPTSTDVAIGASAAATATLLAAYLNASANTSIDDATYTPSGAVVTVTHDTVGTAGNSFTLAKSGSNIAVSGANLTGGAAGSSSGVFQVVGTSTGEVLAARANSTYEDNVIAALALIDFVIKNTADPSTSESTAKTCSQQRKVLKEVLQELAAAIRPNVNSVTDDRATHAATVRTKAVAKYNGDNRPSTL